MKLLCVNKFYRRSGGAETYMFNLMDLLVRMNHDVVPFSMQDTRNEASYYEKYFVSKVDYHQDRHLRQKVFEAGRILYSFESKRRIRELIRDTNPSLAHCHNVYHQISPSIFHAIKEQGLPIVLTAHDYKLLCGNYKMLSRGTICERCCEGSHYHAVLQRCMKGSLAASLVASVEMYLHRFLQIYSLLDVIISPSLFLKAKLVQYGFPSDKIVHIPNFVDASMYEPCYENHGYFLYLGRLVEEKGLKTLLAAMKKIPDRRLWVLGDGPLESELQSFAREHQLENVSFRGFLTGTALVSAIRDAAFIVLPSECYENNPLSILEAFAMGKPVVASRIGGIPELVDEGQDGLLFETGNSEDLAQKVDLMFSDRKQLGEMGKTARAKVADRYAPEHHYCSIMQVYESLVSA